MSEIVALGELKEEIKRDHPDGCRAFLSEVAHWGGQEGWESFLDQ